MAFNEVQAKVNEVLRELPDDTDPPVVQKVEVGASPVLWLVLQGDRTLQQLNRYARNQIKKRLETVDGVGEVVIGGERERTIPVNLHIERMAMLGGAILDRDKFLSLRGRAEALARRLKEVIGGIQSQGCLVKDLDQGLLDFPSRYQGREVYLCWKLDEPEVMHWHDRESGFAGRQPLTANSK